MTNRKADPSHWFNVGRQAPARGSHAPSAICPDRTASRIAAVVWTAALSTDPSNSSGQRRLLRLSITGRRSSARRPVVFAVAEKFQVAHMAAADACRWRLESMAAKVGAAGITASLA
jgi:hypothetical protein